MKPESVSRGAESPPLRGLSVGELLRDAAARRPDHTALVEGVADPSARRRWTYRELLADAERAARAMLAGIRPGERIAIWAPNLPEYQIAQYGAALAGLVVVTVNPAFGRDEAKYALEFAEVSAVFTVSEFRGRRPLDLARQLREEVSTLREVVDLEDCEDYLARGATTTPLPHVDPKSPAQIVYTSGTTGSPKGALLGHAAITDNARRAATNITGSAADRAVWLATLPMFHLAGCLMAALGTLSLAGTLVTVRSFDAGLVLRLTEEERVSVTNMVPTLMWSLLRHPDWDVRDSSSFHSVMLSGAPVSPELAKVVKEQGILPIIGYGLTEAGGVAATRADDGIDDLVSTIGRALPHVALRIADPETGRPRELGQPGEIQTRGPHTFLGYWRDEAATEAAWTDDGWLRTGDLGSMDERGFVKITGRQKEMIIRGGENIYPREIEDALSELSGVLDAAVTGLPDDYYGEIVAAFVRTTSERPSPSRLEASLRKHLTGYKIPARWFYVEEFPLTASGKVQKFALTEGWREGRYREESA